MLSADTIFSTIEAPIPSHYHQYQCPRPSRSWPHLPGKPSLCKRRSFQKSPENCTYIMVNKPHAGDNQKLIASNVFFLLLIDMSYSPWRKFGNLLSSLIADMKVFQLQKNYHYSLLLRLMKYLGFILIISHCDARWMNPSRRGAQVLLTTSLQRGGIKLFSKLKVSLSKKYVKQWWNNRSWTPYLDIE